MASNIQDNDSSKEPGQLLQDSGMYVFMDEVSHETIKPVVEWILCANHVGKRRKKELLLMICSEGGSVDHAFALIDVMRSSNIPIKTVGLGTIASSGLLIFLAGAKGSRILTPNTSILSHQYSAYSEGKHHELFSITKEFNLVNERMVEHYKKTTGLDTDTIKSQLLPSSDVWLTAEEALALGICDYISDLKK
jgi:ATP-dependent Clp protease protease subunit